MSIINDALKKVQQSLTTKADETQVSPSPANQNASAYIYDSSATVETLPQTNQQIASQKQPIQDKIKSILAVVLATVITVASVLYVWQQFQTNIPKVQTFAQKSFNQLIHKIHPSKPKPPENLGSLAQLTINPSTNDSSKLTPITLDIHGIMSNASGNLVLINDQVYQEGDIVDGAKIIKINLDSIKVINNGVEQTIFVKD